MKPTIYTVITLLLLAVVSQLIAADDKTMFDVNLMLTQNSYSDNWSSGEAGSVSWVMNANYMRKKVLSPVWRNKSTVKIALGQTHNQNSETNNWAKPVKSTDLIDMETLFRMKLGIVVDPFISGRLLTQFLDGSDSTKERIFNPMTFTETFGVARMLLDSDAHDWSMRIGFGFRQMLNRDVLNPVTNTRKNQSTNDGGIELVSDLSSNFTENLSYKSKLILFKALYYSKAGELEGQPNANYWKGVDVNWEHIFTASVTQYIDVNLYLQLLYDKEVDLAGRFKETLSFGLTYKLK